MFEARLYDGKLLEWDIIHYEAKVIPDKWKEGGLEGIIVKVENREVVRKWFFKDIPDKLQGVVNEMNCLLDEISKLEEREND